MTRETCTTTFLVVSLAETFSNDVLGNYPHYLPPWKCCRTNPERVCSRLRGVTQTCKTSNQWRSKVKNAVFAHSGPKKRVKSVTKPNLTHSDQKSNSWRRSHVHVSPLLASPSAPMETRRTPLLAIKSSALLTLAILWNRILPRSGLGSCSPDNT